MGKAIVVSLTLIIIIAIVAFLIRLSMREATQIGDLNLKQEREMRALLRDAYVIMGGLGPAMDIEDSDILSDRSRVAVDGWLKKHSDYREKELNA